MRAMRIWMVLVLVCGSVVQRSAAQELPLEYEKNAWAEAQAHVPQHRAGVSAPDSIVQPISDSLARVAREQAPLMTATKDDQSRRRRTCGQKIGMGAAIGAAVGYGSGLGLLYATNGSDEFFRILNTFGLMGLGVGVAIGSASCAS